MKKTIVIVLFLIIYLLFFCGTAFAEVEGFLSFSSAEDADGNYIVTLSLDGKDNIEMMQFCVKYDADKLELNSCSIGDGFTGTTAPTVNAKDGEVFLAWDALEPFKGENLLVFSFSVKDGSFGIASVRINRDEEFVFADKDFNEILITDTALEITVGKESASTETETKAVESDSIGQGQNNGIDLNTYSVYLKTGETRDIAKEHNIGILWTSGNEAVATVEDGVVSGIGKGITVITAESEGGDKNSTCVVGVDIRPVNEKPEAEQIQRCIPVLPVIMIAAVILVIFFAVVINKKGKEKKQ